MKKFLTTVSIMCLVLGIVLMFMTPPQSYGESGVSSSCKTRSFNVQGTSGADVSVSTSAVLVMADNPYRCSALIYNSGSYAMRCGSASVTASTYGYLIVSGASLVLDASNGSSQKALYCIRTGSNDTAANVMEVSTQ